MKRVTGCEPVGKSWSGYESAPFNFEPRSYSNNNGDSTDSKTTYIHSVAESALTLHDLHSLGWPAKCRIFTRAIQAPICKYQGQPFTTSNHLSNSLNMSKPAGKGTDVTSTKERADQSACHANKDITPNRSGQKVEASKEKPDKATLPVPYDHRCACGYCFHWNCPHLGRCIYFCTCMCVSRGR